MRVFDAAPFVGHVPLVHSRSVAADSLMSCCDGYGQLIKLFFYRD